MSYTVLSHTTTNLKAITDQIYENILTCYYIESADFFFKLDNKFCTSTHSNKIHMQLHMFCVCLLLKL